MQGSSETSKEKIDKLINKKSRRTNLRSYIFQC